MQHGLTHPPHLHTPVAQAPWPPAAHGQVSVSLSGRGTPLLASDPNRSLADFLAHSSSDSGSGAEGSQYSPRPWPYPPQGWDRSQKGHQGRGSTRDPVAEGRKSCVCTGWRDINLFNEPPWAASRRTAPGDMLGRKDSHMIKDRLPRERGIWLGCVGGESKQPVGRCRGEAGARQVGTGRGWPGWNEGVRGQEGELDWQPSVEAYPLLQPSSHPGMQMPGAPAQTDQMGACGPTHQGSKKLPG